MFSLRDKRVDPPLLAQKLWRTLSLIIENRDRRKKIGYIYIYCI
jgi:hypothetical protein